MLRKLFLAFLSLSSLAFGQGAFVPPQTAFRVVNGVTAPIANATITVCAANAGGIPCSPALTGTIFKDAALTQALSNPFTSDATGNYQFAATSGTYTVTVTASGFAGNSYQVSIPAGAGTATGAVFPNSSPTLPTFTALAPCSSGNTNSIFQRADSSYASLSFNDQTSSANLPTPVGTFTYCNRLFVNDTSVPIKFPNSLFSLYHTWGAGTTTTVAGDDRALAVRTETLSSISGNQMNSRLQGIYGEVGIKGAPTGFGSGSNQGQDGLMFVIDDEHTGTGANALQTPSIGVIGEVNSSTGGGTYSGLSVAQIGVQGVILQANSGNQGGVAVAGLQGNVNNPGGATNLTGVGVDLPYSSSGAFPAEYGGWCHGAWRSTDYCLVNDGSGAIYDGGTFYATGLNTSTGVAMTGNGSIAQTGSLSLNELTGPSIINVGQTGTPGSTSYTYEICAVDGNSGVACGGTHATATGNATLNGTNFNNIGFACTPQAVSYNIYRTASGGTPSSTGKIGNFVSQLARGLTNSNCLFSDTGLSGDSTSPPTANGTASIAAPIFQMAPGFTVANLPAAASYPGAMVLVTDSTSISAEGQTCTGLSTNKALAFSNGSAWKCF